MWRLLLLLAWATTADARMCGSTTTSTSTTLVTVSTSSSTSTSGASTSTSTSITTSTTLAFVQDDFERASLGANWTNETSDPICAILGSSDLAQTGANSFASCGYSAFMNNTVAYACGLVTYGGAANDGDSAICLGMGTTKGVCCEMFATTTHTAEDFWVPSKYDGSGTGDGCGNGTGFTFPATTLYIGIERLDATTYRCSYSTTGDSWTPLTDDCTASTSWHSSDGDNPGFTGAGGFLDVGTPALMESWEGGNGTLPTTHVCGSPTTSSTSTSTTVASTSSSTSTSLATTTTSTSTTAASATTSTSTSTTTTTTSGGTTTTASFVQDNFDRAGPGIGGNWIDVGSSCVIRSSDVLSADVAIGECDAVYTATTPGSTNTYACAKLSFTGAAHDGAGPCLAASDDFTTAVCCLAQATGWELFDYGDGGTDSGSDTFATGDFIGIQRTSTTAFRCYKSTNGTSWTALGTGTTSTGNPDPGKWGAVTLDDDISNRDDLTQWEGGEGTLPTGHTCGG